jgi:hypothetical protein
MMRRMFLVVFPLLAVFALSGCTTILLIGEASETVTEEYFVDGADGAWFGKNGDLTVCLFGQAPRRPSADFAVSVPAGGLAAPGNAGPIAVHRVPPDHIATPCGPPPEGARAIPVEYVGAAAGPGPQREQYWEPAQGQEREPDLKAAPDQDPEQPTEQDPEQPAGEQGEPGPDGDRDFVTMPEYMDRDGAGAKIFLFEDAENDLGATVIHRHEAPTPDGARFTRLDLPVRETNPNAALLLLIPVTLAVDVLLIYLCIENPAGCS